MAAIGRPVPGVLVLVIVVLEFTVVWQEVRRRFAVSSCLLDQFLFHLLVEVLHNFQNFLEILSLSDIARCFLLEILKLHRTSLKQQFRELSPTHCASYMKWSVVIKIEGVHVAFGRDENSNNSSVPITTSSVQGSVAIIVVNGSTAASIQQFSQRLIVSILGCQMKCREPTEVDTVDEMVFLPAQLLLVRVLVEILRVNIA